MEALEVCRMVAGNVEDGVIQEAVIVLLKYGESVTASSVRDVIVDKPCLNVDWHGEEGNVFWLVCRSIHILMKGGREISACKVLMQYAGYKNYNAVIAFLRLFVDFKGA